MGGGLTSGKGTPFNLSCKLKINGRSSAEIKIIGVDDSLTQVSWMNHFKEAQGWMMNATVHQDNRSAISLKTMNSLAAAVVQNASMCNAIL